VTSIIYATILGFLSWYWYLDFLKKRKSGVQPTVMAMRP
jgi:hypothetical protein